MKNKRGFTVIELMVVLSILLILAILIYAAWDSRQTNQLIKNNLGQYVQTTKDNPVIWTAKHPNAKIISMSEQQAGEYTQYRLTIIYEETENAELERVPPTR
jgi:prepilin-type N-terminal cleavage/methylation domain-containing protein